MAVGRLPILKGPALQGRQPSYSPPGEPSSLWQRGGSLLGTAIGQSMGTAAIAPLVGSATALTTAGAGLGGLGAAGFGAAAGGLAKGAAVGSSLGPIGMAALGIAGAIVGGFLGDVFSGGGSPPKPRVAKPRPTFQGGQPYQSGASAWSDPGSRGGAPIQPNVRLSAANNLKKKFA